MKFVGADLHKKSITLSVVVMNGTKTQLVKNCKILCKDTSKLREVLQSLVPFKITVEATIGFDWFASLASEFAERVVIAHPGKMRVIAESTRKTDKIDARILADFLAHDMIPEAWRPTDRVRQHRSLVRRRRKLSSRVTSIRNTIRAILTRYNLDRKDLFTREGRKAALQMKLLPADMFLIEDLFEDLKSTEDRLEKIEIFLSHFASKAPQAEKEARAILGTFPQMGPITVDTILAELGDWQRFRNAKSVVAFAGLDPGVRESDQKRKNLKLSKEGSPLLRWVMIQLAQRLKKRSPRWKNIYARLEANVGNKKATCALARRLLVVVYAMLRDMKAYQLVAAA
jgi:transposase